MRNVIIYERRRTLIDRQTLAHLAGRSVHTVRARCPIAEHRGGRALYDLEQAAAILADVPTRRRHHRHADSICAKESDTQPRPGERRRIAGDPARAAYII